MLLHTPNEDVGSEKKFFRWRANDPRHRYNPTSKSLQIYLYNVYCCKEKKEL